MKKPNALKTKRARSAQTRPAAVRNEYRREYSYDLDSVAAPPPGLLAVFFGVGLKNDRAAVSTEPVALVGMARVTVTTYRRRAGAADPGWQFAKEEDGGRQLVTLTLADGHLDINERISNFAGLIFQGQDPQFRVDNPYLEFRGDMEELKKYQTKTKRGNRPGRA